MDWTDGLDWWTGLMDWTGGLDWWTGVKTMFMSALTCRVAVGGIPTFFHRL